MQNILTEENNKTIEPSCCKESDSNRAGVVAHCGRGAARVSHTVGVQRHRRRAPALWLRSEV